MSGPAPGAPQTPVEAPRGIAGRWVRFVVSFGVGSVIGLAPYLGLVQVPPFKSLLEMIPESLRPTTIPVAAALMGIIAVAVQWYAGERVTRRWLRRRFGWALGIAVAMVFLFMFVQTTYVVTVTADGGATVRSFVVATARLPSCKCPPSAGDQICINGLGWNEAEIEQCWGDRPVRQARNILRASYLFTTGSFAVLVGLLLLRKE